MTGQGVQALGVFLRMWLYSGWDPAISRMQTCIWKSTAYRGQGTLSEEGERRTETQGPGPRACQQAAGGDQGD